MPESEPDVTEVKRALASLAVDEPLTESREAVDEATEAIGDVDRAATFADNDGPARLNRAIDRASRAGAHDLARRGQRALAAFQWFQRAAVSSPDHFQDARGTDLTEEGKPEHR